MQTIAAFLYTATSTEKKTSYIRPKLLDVLPEKFKRIDHPLLGQELAAGLSKRRINVEKPPFSLMQHVEDGKQMRMNVIIP